MSRNKKTLKNNAYYIYGRHAALSALNNKKRNIINVMCTSDIFNLNQAVITQYSYKIVNNSVLSDLLPQGVTHQGIVIQTTPIALNDIYELDLSSSDTKIAILDQITDEHNIGAIIRSAAAFGIKAIILTYDNSPDESGVMAKIASGALETVKLVRVINLRSIMDELKKLNFWIIGFDGDSKTLLTTDQMKGKIAIILGAEGAGMRRLTKENCDIISRIPMLPGNESINVSNAAAIVFWEAYKANEN